MSHNNRKRKHKPSGSAGYRHYPVVEAPEPEQFLAHHQGYQPQAQLKSQPSPAADSSNVADPLRVLYIQAHEADIVHGDDAQAAAESLEVIEYRAVLTASGSREISVLPRIGSALIQWGTSTSATNTTTKDTIGIEEINDDKSEDEQIELHPTAVGSESSIWVDRYVLHSIRVFRLLQVPWVANFGCATVLQCASIIVYLNTCWMNRACTCALLLLHVYLKHTNSSAAKQHA